MEVSSKHFFTSHTVYTRWLLTAAHCLNGLNITAYFGMSAAGSYKKKVTVPQSNQHSYPTFNRTALTDDMGLQ